MRINSILGKRIMALLEKKEMTIKQFSNDLNINYSTLDNYIIGDRSMPLEVLVKISNYFDVPTDYLLGVSDLPSKDNISNTIYKYTGLNEENINRLYETIKARFDSLLLHKNPIENHIAKSVTDSLNKWIDFFFENIETINGTLLNLESTDNIIYEHQDEIKNVVEGIKNNNAQCSEELYTLAQNIIQSRKFNKNEMSEIIDELSYPHTKEITELQYIIENHHR